ncbi:hypothetical protein LY622_12905 [Halomonas sp. M5N1S17]|uniref:hypothetical protein n=1 Tax=Halomonas alkalisoli TaxID=2907158 RepID=UPI001F1DE2C1|nr:hypothetical protein [Halomonas alkalisoli]MCE9664341.1 hypothetical protein [Halomonas alkalisoli]
MRPDKMLSSRFNNDLDKIASSLIRTYGLKYERKIDNLSRPLLRWLDFRLRYVDPRPRRVCLSNQFPKKLPCPAHQGLIDFSITNSIGSDINRLQGKGLVLFNDTSGKKATQRTDHLWADWGIHHFHLCTKEQIQKSYFSPRSDWLAFCFVQPNSIHVIDIRPHTEKNVFSNDELVYILAESWPEVMQHYELRGILPGRSPTPEERKALRRSGVTSFINIGEKAYAPLGMGITTASTPTRVSHAEMILHQYTAWLGSYLIEGKGTLSEKIKKEGVKLTELELTLTKEGVALYSPKANLAWRTSAHPEDVLTIISNAVAPDWAIAFAKHRTENAALAWHWEPLKPS